MIVFVGLHVPGFGFAQVIPVTFGAIVLTLLYWKRRDYWSNALAHFVTDFAAFGAAALTGH
jgi:membrane protease YdiL (CAAX protease family)